MKKILIVFLSVLLLTGCSPAKKFLECNVSELSKHGNVKLNVTPSVLEESGMEPGDIVDVEIGNKTFTMPIGTSYFDVDAGEMILREDPEDDEVIIAINNGDFASSTPVWVKEKIDEEPGYRWITNAENEKEIKVKITLNTKGGYLDEYTIRNLNRTNSREDYIQLSDEEYANFREVHFGRIAEGILYRSSSPVDPDLGRNEYVMKAAEAAGISSFINIDDTRDEMMAYEGFEGSYYSEHFILNSVMSYDYYGEEFASKLSTVIDFMITHKGPYLIHCKEGKDRTGVVAAIFECVMDANYDEVADDYMKTFENFYGVKKGSETYGIILNSFNKTLEKLFGVENIAKCNLHDAACSYLNAIGIDADRISMVNQSLDGTFWS